jgi:hypothetical protein
MLHAQVGARAFEPLRASYARLWIGAHAALPVRPNSLSPLSLSNPVPHSPVAQRHRCAGHGEHAGVRVAFAAHARRRHRQGGSLHTLASFRFRLQSLKHFVVCVCVCVCVFSVVVGAHRNWRSNLPISSSASRLPTGSCLRFDIFCCLAQPHNDDDDDDDRSTTAGTFSEALAMFQSILHDSLLLVVNDHTELAEVRLRTTRLLCVDALCCVCLCVCVCVWWWWWW